jgi:hypothetical protein
MRDGVYHANKPGDNIGLLKEYYVIEEAQRIKH